MQMEAGMVRLNASRNKIGAKTSTSHAWSSGVTGVASESSTNLQFMQHHPYVLSNFTHLLRTNTDALRLGCRLAQDLLSTTCLGVH